MSHAANTSKKLTTLQFRTVMRSYAAVTGQDMNNIAIRNMYQSYVNDVYVHQITIAFEQNEALLKKYAVENKFLNAQNIAQSDNKREILLSAILTAIGNGYHKTADIATEVERVKSTVVNCTKVLIEKGYIGRRTIKNTGGGNDYDYFYLLADLKKGNAV